MSDEPAPHRSFATRLVAGTRSALVTGARTLIDLALPPVCLACRAPVTEPHGLCMRCWGAMPFIERPYCDRLGVPFAYDLGPGALSAEAIARPPPYRRARSATIYAGPARDLALGLKFHDRTDHARLMARLTARAGAELFAHVDLIVPLPLHRRRLLHRRFNQAALMARQIAAQTGLPLEVDALHRIRATDPQTGLSGTARHANVTGAFRVPAAQAYRVAGRNVLLVDDVITTGATAAAATRALLRAGASAVDLLTFARVSLAGLGEDAAILADFEFGG